MRQKKGILKNKIKEEIKNIKISDYTYNLPDKRIAKHPANKRDESKLLHYKNSNIETYKFNDITSLLKKDDLLVFNNAKVIQARLEFFKETGGRIEIFCLEPHNPADYNGLATSATKQQDWAAMAGYLGLQYKASTDTIAAWASQDALKG